MILSSPNSVAFSLFGYEIYYYGIIMAVAVFAGFFVSNYISKKDYNMGDALINIAPMTIFLSLLGARLYYCLLDFGYYSHHLREVFNFRGGGLSIHGAIFTGIVCIFYYSKKYGFKFSDMLDVFAYSMPLAQTIGRWGNFFNSEAYGLPYNGFLKLYIPPENRFEQYMDISFYHPTFLYESVLDLVLFIVLFSLRNRLKSGNLFLLYLIGYSVIRIVIEALRVDATAYIHGIALPQIVSLAIIIVSLLALLVSRRR